MLHFLLICLAPACGNFQRDCLICSWCLMSYLPLWSSILMLLLHPHLYFIKRSLNNLSLIPTHSCQTRIYWEQNLLNSIMKMHFQFESYKQAKMEAYWLLIFNDDQSSLTYTRLELIRRVMQLLFFEIWLHLQLFFAFHLFIGYKLRIFASISQTVVK